MAEDLNASILLKELKPYQWIFSIFGLNFPPFLIYRSHKDVKYYLVLIIYFLYCVILFVDAVWAAYIHSVIIKGWAVTLQLDYLTEVVTYMQNIFMAGLQLVFLYKCWCGHLNLLEILQLINKLEHNMLKICPIIFKNQMLRKRLLITTSLFLIMLVSFLILLNYYLTATNLELRNKLFFAFFLMVVQIKFLDYGIYVQLIYEYMLMLLKSLQCLREKVENEVDRQQPLAGYYHKSLRQNQACLMEIWFVVYKLEQYFAWPIFILFFYNGIIILYTVSWAYVQYLFEIKTRYQILRLAYITVVLLNMLLLCYLTQKCINEYQKFSYLLLNFKLYPHDVQMKMISREYSLQLMHQRIQFTCNGYMDIDLSYYGKTILVIFAYVIIVLQFKLTDVSEGIRRATKHMFQRL
ncbi:putative gustatory receptor 98b [Calliphora vicina]|uniref:putative gustatory receptor 98b n=1 Tax=Calliphora vicina TaxID=7373 RepID=UPI00325B9CCD